MEAMTFKMHPPPPPGSLNPTARPATRRGRLIYSSWKETIALHRSTTHSDRPYSMARVMTLGTQLVTGAVIKVAWGDIAVNGGILYRRQMEGADGNVPKVSKLAVTSLRECNLVESWWETSEWLGANYRPALHCRGGVEVLLTMRVIRSSNVSNSDA